MSSEALLVLLAQTTALLMLALLACRLAKDNPEVRLLVCRAAFVATIVAAIGSPWLHSRPRPLIPVRFPPMAFVKPRATSPVTVGSDSANSAPLAAKSPSAPTPEPTRSWRPDFGEILEGAWLAGCVVLTGVMGAGYLKLFLVRRKTKVVPVGPLVDGVWRACAEFQVRPPMVRAGQDVSTPFVASVCLPTLYVPQSWVEGGEPELLDAICRHEIAHLAGRDLQWQFAQRICTILLWPHPLLWLIARASTLAGEQVCDRKVLAGGFPAKAYAESLLKLKDGLAFTRGLEPVGIGAVSIRSAFGQRIATIMKNTDIVRRELSRSGKLGLVLCCGLVTGLATTLIAAPSLKDAAHFGHKEGVMAEAKVEKVELGTLTGWSPCVGYETPYIVPPSMQSKLTDFTFGRDPGVSLGGKPSARFSVSKQDNLIPKKGLAQQVRADAFRGKRIRLTGSLKTQDIEYGGLLFLVSAMDHMPAIEDMSGRTVTGTTDWTRYSCVVDVPEDAVAIQVGAWISGPGKAWMADFSIETVDPAKVPSTAPKAGANVENDIDHPENLDFRAPQQESSPEKVPGWWAEGGDWQTIQVDRGESNPVVTVSNGSKDNAPQNGLVQEVLADHYRGKRVRFQGLAKGSGQVSFGTTIAIPGGGIWADTPANLRSKADAKGWRTVSTVADIPTWAYCFQFGVFVNGTGKASFRNCSLTIVDPKTPLTQDPPRLNFTKEELDALPSKFVNLDFQN